MIAFLANITLQDSKNLKNNTQNKKPQINKVKKDYSKVSFGTVLIRLRTESINRFRCVGKVAKRLLASSRLSVCPYVRNSSAPT